MYKDNTELNRGDTILKIGKNTFTIGLVVLSVGAMEVLDHNPKGEYTFNRDHVHHYFNPDRITMTNQISTSTDSGSFSTFVFDDTEGYKS